MRVMSNGMEYTRVTRIYLANWSQPTAGMCVRYHEEWVAHPRANQVSANFFARVRQRNWSQSDCHLFTALKQNLGGHRFIKNDREELTVVTQWPDNTGHGLISTENTEACHTILKTAELWRRLCGNAVGEQNSNVDCSCYSWNRPNVYAVNLLSHLNP
jgi:hypothetical protein